MRMQLCGVTAVLAIIHVGCGSSSGPPAQVSSVSGDMAAAASGGGADLAKSPPSDLATTPGVATSASVSVGPGIAYSPTSVTIARGGTVTWSWSGGLSHSVTSGSCSGSCTPDGKFGSSIQSSGSFKFTFNASGDFPYFCQVHGAMMTAVVHVQ